MASQREFDTVLNQKAHEALISQKIDEALEGFDPPEGGGENYSEPQILLTWSGNDPDLTYDGEASTYTIVSDPLPTEGSLTFNYYTDIIATGFQSTSIELQFDDDAEAVLAAIETALNDHHMPERVVEVTGGPLSEEALTISVTGRAFMESGDSVGDGDYTITRDVTGSESADFYELGIPPDMILTECWVVTLTPFAFGEAPYMRIVPFINNPLGGQSFYYGEGAGNQYGLEETEIPGLVDAAMPFMRNGPIMAARGNEEAPTYLVMSPGGHGEAAFRVFGICVPMSRGGI